MSADHPDTRALEEMMEQASRQAALHYPAGGSGTELSLVVEALRSTTGCLQMHASVLSNLEAKLSVQQRLLQSLFALLFVRDQTGFDCLMAAQLSEIIAAASMHEGQEGPARTTRDRAAFEDFVAGARKLMTSARRLEGE